MVEIVVLIITRWHDTGSRMFLRNTLDSKIQSKHQNMKLLFLFGVPSNATTTQIDQITEENKEYQDMVIPSESILIYNSKVENILKGSLCSIPSPSPSVKIRIIALTGKAKHCWSMSTNFLFPKFC